MRVNIPVTQYQSYKDGFITHVSAHIVRKKMLFYKCTTALEVAMKYYTCRRMQIHNIIITCRTNFALHLGI